MVALIFFQSVKPFARFCRVGRGYDTLNFPTDGLALYDATRLSVPDSAVDSVSLTQPLRSDARDCVNRWSELVLNFGS